MDINNYNLDKWYNKLEDDFVDLYQDNYKAIQDYYLIEIDKNNINYFNNHKTFDEELKNKIIKLINDLKEKYFNSYLFFRLNTRSPKDVLEYKDNLEIIESDNRKIKIDKKIKQLEVLKISNYEDIIKLLITSNRTKEDMFDFINKNIYNKLFLVFTKWNQILGNYTEYRCCIINKKPISISLFKPEYYSSSTIIPVEIILIFLYQVIKRLDYNNFVIDVYIKNNRCYIIEINPLCEDTDLFTLEYNDIISSDNLIVTL